MSIINIFGAIPYRREAAVDLSDAGHVFFWVFVLLAATSALIFFMKKKGLLRRWQSDAEPSSDGLKITRRGHSRLSPSTVVYFLEIEGELMVFVESKSNVLITNLRK